MLLSSLIIKEKQIFLKFRFFNKIISYSLLHLLLLVIVGQSLGLYRVSAQINFSKKCFTTDNGLSHNFIQDISEDKNGFLWISTWDGLNRFDGYEFKSYFHKPNDSTTFPFFIVEKTVVDNLNNVWVVCPRRAVVRYNRVNDSFDKFKPDKYNEFVASDIVSGNNNDIWLINQEVNNLYHYNLKTTTLDSFKLVNKNGSKQMPFETITEITKDNEGNFWITDFLFGDYKIYKGNFKNNKELCLTEFELVINNYSELAPDDKKPTVFQVYVDSNKATWLFTSFGLFKTEIEDTTFGKYDSDVNPKDFTEKNRLFWSAPNTGIHIIDTKANKTEHIKPETDKYTGCIFIDSQNTIWTGNINEAYDNIGLNRYVRNPNLLQHYLTEKNERKNQNIIVPIVQDKYNNIWVGTKELNYLFKIKTDRSISKVHFLTNYKGNNHPKVKSMVSDSDGIWMGCTGDLLILYDYKEQLFTPYFFDNQGSESISDIGLHNILKVNNDIIINGFNNRTGVHAVYRFNISSRELKTVLRLKNPCLCMVKDGNNGFWMGAISSTIIHLSPDFTQIKEYKIGKGKNLVEHICLADNGNVWAALMGGGLVHFNPQTKQTETFTMTDGLPSNTISSILKDKQGNLWFSTNQGISRFNPITKHFRNFGQAEGVMIREFNSDSYFQTSEGEMYFGGVGGMIQFHPDSVEKKLSIAHSDNLLITDFSVSGIPRYSDKPIYEADTIILEKGDNNFQLTFAKIELNHPEKINYRYRLSGKNNNWIETDYRHRDISYANLVPGKYKIEIESTNIEGVWETKKSLSIQIPGFYYQTFLFKLVIFILIIAIVATIIVNYNQQIRTKAQQKQAKLKLESLRGQMNPHFIFNSLNSINYFISNNDKVSANSYIADFSNLIRNFLSNLSCNYVPVEKELKIINDYLKLEHLRFGDKFDYNICTKEIPEKSHISIFPGIVQPFIENAIWHGVRGLENRKGLIEIKFILQNKKTICCTIEDDGVGRKLSEKYSNRMPGKKSRGIDIVMERLSVVNNISQMTYGVNIKDKYPEREETGTIVTIHIPIKYMVEQECQ